MIFEIAFIVIVIGWIVLAVNTDMWDDDNEF